VSVSLAVGFATRWKHAQPQLLVTSDDGVFSWGYVPEYRIGMTSIRGGHSGGPYLEIASGMGRIGDAAHGVRVVFASCSHLTCIIYFAIFAVVFAVFDCGQAAVNRARPLA
jgi:hypothetical protein